ncbi:hypothetical protein IDH44_21525 [Paenibacillus sp. IB182496]|uniref:Type II secretion system protein GspF domain-containing protein n=1 Tax=Paenibacillus sabuli TaxID=2772509 RepID=A0A927BVU3_9BACL|nr:hypothetical protein [Paenibacillus sabuli]MBD2847782.1 hypothetical protein [Paenibacillus sabuli]
MQAETTLVLLKWTALIFQYGLGFVCAAALLRALLYRRPRWAHLVGDYWQRRRVPGTLLRAAGLSREGRTYDLRLQLLAGAGYTGDPAAYLLLRRILLLGIPGAALVWTQLAKHLTAMAPPSAIALAAGAALYGAVLWDTPWLEALRQVRTQRIVKEIYVISNQLLYLSGSSLNVHTKLMRCLPYARVLRGELQRMLGEWYHDAEGALRRFKQRVGTEEGHSFVETIASLRLHENEEYYRLLRERIHDYKEKLDLAKESRKESASYMLFVLAGIPILYMFQIFIYPWVQEGNQLFQSLNP